MINDWHSKFLLYLDLWIAFGEEMPKPQEREIHNAYKSFKASSLNMPKDAHDL